MFEDLLQDVLDGRKCRKRKLVVISVAHSMYAKGARNEQLSISEYDYSLWLSMKLVNLLNVKNICKALVVDYSYVDSYHEMMRRKVEEINSFNPKVAIELHFNAYNRNTAGHEVLYSSELGRIYADIINRQLSGTKELKINRGIKQRDDLFFLKATSCPAVIVEPLFIDNVSEAILLKEEKFLNNLVDKLFLGIKEIINS